MTNRTDCAGMGWGNEAMEAIDPTGVEAAAAVL
jgi:hypothetical protein